MEDPAGAALSLRLLPSHMRHGGLYRTFLTGYKEAFDGIQHLVDIGKVGMEDRACAPAL